MSKWLSLTVLACTFPATALADPFCDLINSHIKFEITSPMPTPVKAGDTVSVDAIIHFQAGIKKEIFKDFPIFAVVVEGTNKAYPEANLIRTNFVLSETQFTDDSGSFQFKISLPTAAAMGGSYDLETSIFSGTGCTDWFAGKKDQSVFVVNTPEATDLEAPQVKSLASVKAQYELNETLVVHALITDKSYICNPFLCPLSPNIYLILEPVAGGSPVYSYVKTQEIGIGVYEMTVPLSEGNFVKGQYKITAMYISDNWYNKTEWKSQTDITFTIL